MVLACDPYCFWLMLSHFSKVISEGSDVLVVSSLSWTGFTTNLAFKILTMWKYTEVVESSGEALSNISRALRNPKDRRLFGPFGVYKFKTDMKS